jgi:hypothetical protein
MRDEMESERIKELEEVAQRAQALLDEIDNAPTVPETGGTIGQLRDALDDLREWEDVGW